MWGIGVAHGMFMLSAGICHSWFSNFHSCFWFHDLEYALESFSLSSNIYQWHKGQSPQRRKWQPTPVFLSEESHGQRSLLSYIQSMGSQRVRHSWVTENARKHKEWNTHLLLASTMCQALCKNVCVHHFTSSFQLFYMMCIIKPIFQVKKLRLKESI